MEYSGIFQKYTSTSLISYFFFHKTTFFCFLWNMEYSKKNPQQDTFQFVGIWNIPEKNINSENLENYGIWNIPGIFQKNS